MYQYHKITILSEEVIDALIPRLTYLLIMLITYFILATNILSIILTDNVLAYLCVCDGGGDGGGLR